jgi:hypothetical protein
MNAEDAPGCGHSRVRGYRRPKRSIAIGAACRGWKPQTGIAAAAVLSLAIGIGANTAIFSMFHALGELVSFYCTRGWGRGYVSSRLAGIGLYGVVAYGTGRRAREIGIRVRLGARRASVVWIILRDALKLVAIGMAIACPCETSRRSSSRAFCSASIRRTWPRMPGHSCSWRSAERSRPDPKSSAPAGLTTRKGLERQASHAL